MHATFDAEYQVALHAALKAGEVVEKYFHQTVAVRHKSKNQPVTVADDEANAIIHQLVFNSFPKDGWLSEETKDNHLRLSCNRVWIVDPLDGTKEFINSIPEFAISIALVVKGRPVVGVVYNPITKEMFSAQVGKGAFLNQLSIHVSSQSDLVQAKILASRSELARDEWKSIEGGFHIVPAGGMAYKMVLVACGKCDGSFSLQPKSEWDICAGHLIVEEAGGMVTQLDGSAFVYNQKNVRVMGIVHSNSLLHSQILKKIS